jgi:hypothetical protein
LNKKEKKMKALRIKKQFPLLAIALLTIFLAPAAISLADDSAMVVKGQIVSVDPDSGEVAVIDDVGKTVMLTASPEQDLKTLQKGDEVTIQYDKNSVIQSIQIQE